MKNARLRSLLAATLIAFATVLLIGAVPRPAYGAEAKGAEAKGTEVIGAEQGTIDIEMNRGILLRLPRPAETVFIANPDIADIQVKSPRLVYIFAKKPGETTLYAADAHEILLASKQIRVQHNLGQLETALNDVVPAGSFAVATVGDSVMLSGSVVSPAEAENARAIAARFTGDDKTVINRLSVAAPTQVHLRVRVAEISRDVIKQIGINWDSVFANGNFLFGLATGNPAVAAATVLPGLTGNAGRKLNTRNLGPGQTTTNSLFGSFATGKVDLNAVIDALEDEGFISILAEPSLTAVSGETASFLAGGEFPIPVPQDNRSITIEFKKFGVGLSFTPTVVGPNRISLHVRPEVSALSNNGSIQFSGFTIPSLTTRRAETTVELGSGQSFAIAGLISNNVNHDINKFPGLGDLPILGPLFRSNTFRKNESELVILVTPYLVRPVATAQLNAPTDGLALPSDSENYLEGHQYKQGQPTNQSAKPRGRDGGGLAGPAGFEVD